MQLAPRLGPLLRNSGIDKSTVLKSVLTHSYRLWGGPRPWTHYQRRACLAEYVWFCQPA
jgi:hypothetical protein